MTFKETQPQFQMLDVMLIDPDPAHARQQIDPASLKILASSIQKKGLIQPLLVQPADAAGRYRLIVGERRWRAAVLAGEAAVPALIRACDPAEALEIQVFENLGLGLRSALEPRDLANAIQTIAQRFATPESAAEHFGRTPTWLGQATAAAKLSPKISALLDSGRIGSAGAAVQLEKLTQKNEAKAESLIERIARQPEGEKLARKTVDHALQEEGGRRRKKAESAAAEPVAPTGEMGGIPPWEDIPAAPVRRQFNPGKVKMVARLLGVADGDEAEVLARLIDEFLALKGEGETPF